MPTRLVAVIERKHASGGAATAQPSQGIALDFSRYPRKDVIDTPGTVSFDPAAVLAVHGVMALRFAPDFLPGICQGVLPCFVPIHGVVLFFSRQTDRKPLAAVINMEPEGRDLTEPAVRQSLPLPRRALAVALI
jgi:hypothetical protein